MTRNTRMFWMVLPLAIVATTAITVAIMSVPWASTLRRLSTVGVLINSRIAPWPRRDPQPPVLDHALIIEAVPGAAEQSPIEIPAELAAQPAVPITPEPAEPNEPVDYARLNQGVMHMADTLDRFNQKLLRMIAQAKASPRSVGTTSRAEEPTMDQATN